jgi:hypothetical protein
VASWAGAGKFKGGLPRLQNGTIVKLELKHSLLFAVEILEEAI